MRDVLRQLCDWYAAQADGDWEHEYGIKIETLDNPGWHVQINLKDTSLEAVDFTEYRDSYDDDVKWLLCRKIDGVFDVACGVPRLEDALSRFLDWAESAR